MNSPARVALVTGGSRGIGLGICRALADDGVCLAVNGVRPEADVAQVLDELRGRGVEVEYCRGDVGVADERTAIVAAVRARFGRLDVLVNNAGITSVGRQDCLVADEAGFDRVLATNLKGPYFLTQACARWMIEQRQADTDFAACVINVTSISAEVVSVNRGDYCLSKAALAMATRVWAVRLAEFGIPVYDIRPGVIASDMTAGVTEKYDRLISEGLTLEKRWGLPADVGRAAAMLVRGDLSYATGQVLRVDGGMTIRSM